MLDRKAAREGTMSYTQQGLFALGLGFVLAPVTGGLSLTYGGVHLFCGVVLDQLKRGQPKDAGRND